jgi:hypothetical protein
MHDIDGTNLALIKRSVKQRTMVAVLKQSFWSREIVVIVVRKAFSGTKIGVTVEGTLPHCSNQYAVASRSSPLILPWCANDTERCV